MMQANKKQDFHYFSEEILSKIFKWLDNQDLDTVGKVCKSWHEVATVGLKVRKEEINARPYEKLNHDVLFHIFSWLNFQDLAIANQVCKNWREIVNSESFKRDRYIAFNEHLNEHLNEKLTDFSNYITNDESFDEREQETFENIIDNIKKLLSNDSFTNEQKKQVLFYLSNYFLLSSSSESKKKDEFPETIKSIITTIEDEYHKLLNIISQKGQTPLAKFFDQNNDYKKDLLKNNLLQIISDKLKIINSLIREQEKFTNYAIESFQEFIQVIVDSMPNKENFDEHDKIKTGIIKDNKKSNNYSKTGMLMIIGGFSAILLTVIIAIVQSFMNSHNKKLTNLEYSLAGGGAVTVIIGTIFYCCCLNTNASQKLNFNISEMMAKLSKLASDDLEKARLLTEVSDEQCYDGLNQMFDHPDESTTFINSSIKNNYNTFFQDQDNVKEKDEVVVNMPDFETSNSDSEEELSKKSCQKK